MWRWGFSPGLWYTFPGGGFVRIVITLLPAILMVVSFSVPIHAISAFDVVQFVAQSALATDDWQTQYWIGYDENNPRCFDNGYCVWEAMSPADPEWWRHNVQFTRAAYAILPELLDEKMAAALIALHAAIRIPVLINNDKHIQRTPLARVILFGYSVVF